VGCRVDRGGGRKASPGGIAAIDANGLIDGDDGDDQGQGRVGDGVGPGGGLDGDDADAVLSGEAAHMPQHVLMRMSRQTSFALGRGRQGDDGSILAQGGRDDTGGELARPRCA